MGGIVTTNGTLHQLVWDEHRRDYEAVGFTKKTIGRMYNLYVRCRPSDRLDPHASVAIIQARLSCSGNEFMRRVFSALEVDKEGEICFKQFVFALWNFLSLPSSNEFFGLLAFDLFNNGIGQPCAGKVIKAILKAVYSQEKTKMSEDLYIIFSSVESKVDGFNTTGEDGKFTADDFARFCAVHALALAPLRKMHAEMQKVVLGPKMWKQLSKIRGDISTGMYIPLPIMLERFKKKQFIECIVAPVNKLMIKLGTSKLPPELAQVQLVSNDATSRANTTKTTPRSEKEGHADPSGVMDIGNGYSSKGGAAISQQSRRQSNASSANSTPRGSTNGGAGGGVSSGNETRKLRLDNARGIASESDHSSNTDFVAPRRSSGDGLVIGGRRRSADGLPSLDSNPNIIGSSKGRPLIK